MNRLKQIENEIADTQLAIDEMKASWKDEAGKERKPTKDEYEAVKAKLDNLKELKEQHKIEAELEANKEEVSGVQATTFQVVQDEKDIKHDSLGHFAMDVAYYAIKGHKPKLLENHEIRMAASGLNEATPSEGGFLVDPEYSDELIRKTHETGILTSRVRKARTNSNVVNIKYVDESSRANGSRFGGVRAYWEGEADSLTSSKPTFGKMQLELKKLTGLSYVTDENLEDAPLLNTLLPEAFSEEFGFKLDEAIVNGTGAGQPLGIYNSNALVSVSKETGQAADTIEFANVLKMYARLWNRSRGRAIVLANQDTIPQLYQMNVAAGTGGVPVFLPASGASGRPYDTIWNMPIIYIEQAQTLGDKGDIYFFDPREYVLIDKGSMKSATSIHLRFDYSETAFRWVYRCDGQPTWDSALTPYKGASNTVSPYITLAARA